MRKGRHQEYLHLLEEDADLGTWADPQEVETFLRCKLRWASVDRAPHAEMLAFYRALIALRRRLPPLRNGRKDLVRLAFHEDERWLAIERRDPGGAATFTAANLADATARVRSPAGRWRLALATEGPPRAEGGGTLLLAPWSAAIYELESPSP